MRITPSYRQTKCRISSAAAALICLTLAPLGSLGSHDVSCETNSDCTEKLNFGTSSCVKGICTNPFHSGCLRAISSKYSNNEYQDEKYVRECNSDDDEGSETSNNDFCKRGTFNYNEVRIAPGNWESSILLSWIFQIVLSEVLDVPVTIDNNGKGSSSFYDINSGFAYTDLAYNFDALQEAHRYGGDCVAAIADGSTSCAHVLPEVWVGPSAQVQKGQDEGFLLPDETNGMIGELGLFIPLHTAMKDWSLTSYHGLQNNRTKMAQRFGRPTSWFEYCNNVTNTDNCKVGDTIAKRNPGNKNEESSYFVSGLYNGYFRKDDCNAYPDNCTGYFVNAPCTWSTYAEAQMFWNNISLKSDGPMQGNNGYSYSQMIQIINAANHTQEDFLMWWYSPDMTNQLFQGTSSELFRVHFPKPTQACLESRPIDKCSNDLNQRLGDSLGSCDYATNPLKKVISMGLETITFESDEVRRSPSLSFLQKVDIPAMAMDDILQKWVKSSADPFNARQLVCEWVFDNMEHMERQIPFSYPRITIQNENFTILLPVAVSFGTIALVVTLVSAVFTIYRRKHRILTYAQVDFLLFNLIGFSFVAVGSIFYATEPSPASCSASIWFVLLGYTLQFVPLLIKIAAINRISHQSMSFQRVDFKLKNLKLAVFYLILLVLLFLSIWTYIDPNTSVVNEILKDREQGIVSSSVRCASASRIWRVITFVWEAVLLLCILVLALQSQSMIAELDESQALTLMVYTHFLFLVLRLIVGWMGLLGSIMANIEGGITSLLLSLDTILCVLIYFGNKFFAIRMSDRRKNRSSGNSLSLNSDRNGRVIMSAKGSRISGLNGSNKSSLNRAMLNDSFNRANLNEGTTKKMSQSLCVTESEKQRLRPTQSLPVEGDFEDLNFSEESLDREPKSKKNTFRELTDSTLDAIEAKKLSHISEEKSRTENGDNVLCIKEENDEQK